MAQLNGLQWPDLPYDAWRETCATLHLWTQIVGKIRLARTPWLNHGWHVTLYVTSTGLTTSPIPHDSQTFEISFDFITHELEIRTSSGANKKVELRPRTVADFHAAVMTALDELAIPVRIDELPCEIGGAVRFSEDRAHGSYDAQCAHRFWTALLRIDRVMKQFRTGFIGKVSPVHYFWGAPDLAVTRFSGRRAPEHPGGVPNLPDRVTREAYSHEVSSCGFWPGGGPIPYAAYYSYAYPEPPGFAAARVRPDGAFYSTDLREFVLPYDVVRQADSPDDTLLQFLQTTYEAAADLGKWDRASLERDGVRSRLG